MNAVRTATILHLFLPLVLHFGSCSTAFAGVSERARYEEARTVLDGYSGDHAVLEKAAGLLKSLLAAYPNSALGTAGLVQLTLSAGYQSGINYDESALRKAREYAERAIALGPDLGDVYVHGGYAYLYSGSLTKARELAAKARNLQPDSARVDLLSAELTLHEKRYDESIKYALASTGKTKDKLLLYKAYMNLWRIYERQERFDLAEKYLLLCIGLNPANPWSLVNYASFFCYSTKNYEKAIEYGEKALARMDFGVAHVILCDAYRNRGWGELQQKRWEESLRSLEKSVAHDPKNADSRFTLGCWYYAHGHGNKNLAELERAEREFARAVEIAPEHTPAQGQLAQVRKLIAWVKSNGGG